MNGHLRELQERPINRESGQIVDVTWTRWLHQTFNDDAFGHWIAFTLNTRYSVNQLVDKFETRCQYTAQLFYHLAPTDSRARTRRRGVCAFVMPAISLNGRLHFHGLIRIPRQDLDPVELWNNVTFNESGCLRTIRIPPVLKHLLFRRPDSEQSTFGDIHLRHDGERVVFLNEDGQTADSVLSYWSKVKDGEMRKFSDGQFVPHAVRAVLSVRRTREPIRSDRSRLVH